MFSYGLLNFEINRIDKPDMIFYNSIGFSTQYRFRCSMVTSLLVVEIINDKSNEILTYTLFTLSLFKGDELDHNQIKCCW